MINLLNLVFIVCFILVLPSVFYACGSPQTISGRVIRTDGQTAVVGATVEIQDTSGGNFQTAQTDDSGYYQFEPTTACLPYRIRIFHSEFTFEVPVIYFYLAGDAEGYQINFRVRKKWTRTKILSGNVRYCLTSPSNLCFHIRE